MPAGLAFRNALKWILEQGKHFMGWMNQVQTKIPKVCILKLSLHFQTKLIQTPVQRSSWIFSVYPYDFECLQELKPLNSSQHTSDTLLKDFFFDTLKTEFKKPSEFSLESAFSTMNTHLSLRVCVAHCSPDSHHRNGSVIREFWASRCSRPGKNAFS